MKHETNKLNLKSYGAYGRIQKKKTEPQEKQRTTKYSPYTWNALVPTSGPQEEETQLPRRPCDMSVTKKKTVITDWWSNAKFGQNQKRFDPNEGKNERDKITTNAHTGLRGSGRRKNEQHQKFATRAGETLRRARSRESWDDLGVAPKLWLVLIQYILPVSRKKDSRSKGIENTNLN